MSMLVNVERVEREIFRQGNFIIKNTVVTGRKGKDNVKLDSIYSKTYPSQKYSSHSELEAINIVTSEYIVFHYSNFENKTNEEIYISYPHLLDLKSFCKTMLNMVMSEKVYTSENKVAMEYNNYQLTSQPMGGNKILVAIPTTIQRDQNLFKGVLLFFNDETKYIELDIKAIFTLNEIIKSIDLLSLSNSTLMLGMMSKINANSFDEVDTYQPAPKSPLPNRGLFGNRNAGFTRRNETQTFGGGNTFGSTVNNPTQSAPQQTKAEVIEDDNPFDNMPPQEPQAPTNNFGGFRKGTPQQTENTNTLPPRNNANANKMNPVPSNPAPTGNDVLSIDNIMSEAENIKFESDADDLIDF